MALSRYSLRIDQPPPNRAVSLSVRLIRTRTHCFPNFVNLERLRR